MSSPSAAAIAAVSFDVTHTLLGLPRLPEIYAAAFRRHGLPAEERDLARLIPEVWQELSCRTRLGEDRFSGHPEGSRGFWGDFVGRLAARLDLPAPSRFLVAELFDRFAHADAWRVYPDVVPALEELASRGLALGVVSNFDERLAGLLDDAGLGRFFTAVVTSADVGVEKPHPAIFHELIGRLELPGSAVLHVGDSRREDVEGAQGAGLAALHLSRDGGGDIASLAELGTRLASAWTA